MHPAIRGLACLSLLSVAPLGCDRGADLGGPEDRSRTAEVPVVVDHGLALRTAAIKLTGQLPTLAEIKRVVSAQDPQVAYNAQIDEYLSSPRLAAQQVAFFRNTFKMGGTGGPGGMVNMEAAPTFAAQLVVSGRPFTEVVTADKDTCVALSADGKFVPGSCAKSASPTVGVLSDPGVMAQFFASMAFRRVRWVHETFLCRKFPVEVRPGGGEYYSPWEMKTISGKLTDPMAPVDFHDTKTQVCANCHTTLNHLAPLFGAFGEDGLFTAPQGGVYAVHTPGEGNPRTRLGDWLPMGEPLAYRLGRPVADLPALGRLIAADPDFPRCLATRVWNFAMSRGDAVVDGATLPEDLLSDLSGTLVQKNYDVKQLLRRVFTHPDFVKY